MELTWHPSQPGPTPATPSARRDDATDLVAWIWPEAGPPALDDEPCDGLGGPWCSATWTRGARSLKATWYPSGARVERREGMRVDYRLERRHDDALRRVVAAMVWVMDRDRGGEGER